MPTDTTTFDPQRAGFHRYVHGVWSGSWFDPKNNSFRIRRHGYNGWTVFQDLDDSRRFFFIPETTPHDVALEILRVNFKEPTP